MVDEIIERLKEKGKYNIVFVGDSLTSCEWVHPNWREMVEYVVKEEAIKEFEEWRIPSWGIRCFNFGFDGGTTKDIVNKLDDITKVEPDLVITMIGANDPILGVTIEEHRENIRKIPGIIATDIKPNDEKLANIYAPYVEIDKEEKGKELIDVFELFKPEDRFFTFKEDGPDNWHPNQLGNAYIAKIFLERIWEIDFDPEKYMETSLKGYKYPEY